MLFLLFERLDPRIPTFDGETEGISDGTLDQTDTVAAPASVASPAAPAEVPVLAIETPDAVPGAGPLPRSAGGSAREALA